MGLNECKKYANNGVSYCGHIKYVKYAQEQITWEQNGYIEFINSGRWCYDFECEDTVIDCEQSFLAQVIYGQLLLACYSGYNVNRDKITVYLNKDLCIKLSMDVMNNPKESHKFGANIKRDCSTKWEKWKEIYHTLGNFTFIPNRKKRGRHLQNIHNDLGERWDLLLNYCRENWDTFSCEQEMTFKEYMKVSFQQMYYKKIYEDLVNKIEGKELSNISNRDYCEWISEWNEIIESSEGELELISYENSDLEIIVEIICKIIEVRGRIIIAISKNRILTERNGGKF